MEEHYPSRLLLAWFIAKLMSHRGHAGHWKVTSMLSALLIFKVEFCPVPRTVHDDIWWHQDLNCLKVDRGEGLRSMQGYSIKQRTANQEASLEMKVCHAVNSKSSWYNSTQTVTWSKMSSTCFIPLYTTYLCTFHWYHQWTLWLHLLLRRLQLYFDRWLVNNDNHCNKRIML